MTKALAATFFDEISGELMVDVPQEIMDEIGITPGDVIVWNVDQDGRVTITKKTEE
jgi:antitoxin component of MazEF toxin-antitoxin module